MTSCHEHVKDKLKGKAQVELLGALTYGRTPSAVVVGAAAAAAEPYPLVFQIPTREDQMTSTYTAVRRT